MHIEAETRKALDAAAKASNALFSLLFRAVKLRGDDFDFVAILGAQHSRDVTINEYVRCRRVNEGVDDIESTLTEIAAHALSIALQ